METPDQFQMTKTGERDLLVDLSQIIASKVMEDRVTKPQLCLENRQSRLETIFAERPSSLAEYFFK